MNRGISILLLILGVSCLFGAGHLNRRLLDIRRAEGITQADPLENAPPLVSFTTIALGGFRGIVADLLWLRSSRLQEEGRYFEMVQLADWITKLEPRFTEVWAYHAWNLAYNISVMFPDPDDRWRWVRHGIDLLRQEGIRYNPGDARLLLELGWLFQHKIAGILDDAHLTYKQNLADDMERLLGGPRPDYGAWRALPDSREELRREAGMGELIDSLKAGGLDPWALDEVLTAATPEQRIAPAWPAYLAFLKRETFARQTRMDPATMEELETRFGPLDWRLAPTHSLYWASLARPFARDTYERVSSDRMIFQSLQEIFRRGRLLRNPERTLFLLSPNLDVLPEVLDRYRAAIAEHDNPTLADGYRNFLIDAIFVLYTYQERNAAEDLLGELKQVDDGIDPNIGLDAFALELFAGRVDQMSPEEATAAVEGALYQSLVWSAAGEPERAAGFERLAVRLWSAYMEPRMDQAAFRERTGLPPLMQLRQSAALRLREALPETP